MELLDIDPALCGESTPELLSPQPVPESPKRGRASSVSSTESGGSRSPSKRPKRYVCGDCGKAYNRPSLLEQHQRSHSNERPFVCMTCNEGFTRKDHLQRHLLKHTDEQDKPYHCRHCGKGVNSPQHLRRHEKVHTKSFLCPHEGCGESFFKHQTLKSHVNTVHNADRFSCSECGKIYNRASRLQDHMEKVHLSIDRLRCDFPTCARSFKTWSALQLHVKTEHPKLECSECGRKCVGESGLQNHMRIHDENKVVKLWQCAVCYEIAFAKKDILIEHYKTEHPTVEMDFGNRERHEEAPAEQETTPPVPARRGSLQRELEHTNALDLVSSNVNARVLPCTFSDRCTRRFKKQYDLDRHVQWHERQQRELAEKLELLKQ